MDCHPCEGDDVEDGEELRESLLVPLVVVVVEVLLHRLSGCTVHNVAGNTEII